MKLQSAFVLVCFGILCSVSSYAQETVEGPTDDLGNVTDAFQEQFFEALKQRAIENHELALESLKLATRSAKGDKTQLAAVNFQIAKNLVSVRRYEDAEAYFDKVLVEEGDKLEVLEAMYDLYYRQQNYAKAIPLVQRLIPKDADYKEDLANLYHRTKQYDKALVLLDELDESYGENAYRNTLRRQIYQVTGNTEGAITNLEEKIDDNPKNEQDYLNLIYLYSEQGNTEKAFETAKTLLANQPKSELVHFALYKFYLNEGNTEAAIASMKKVFTSNQVEVESKYKVLGDFIQFVNDNPSYEAELEETVQLFSAEGNGQVYEKLGDYYVAKNRKEDALKFYEAGIKTDADNFSLLKNTLLLQIEFMKYNDVLALSNQGLEIFPAQPLLYLINGVANNELRNSDAAIESLELGIDYVLDNPIMEKDFYTQLEIAYSQKGDATKAAQFAKRAASIQDSN